MAGQADMGLVFHLKSIDDGLAAGFNAAVAVVDNMSKGMAAGLAEIAGSLTTLNAGFGTLANTIAAVAPKAQAGMAAATNPQKATENLKKFQATMDALMKMDFKGLGLDIGKLPGVEKAMEMALKAGTMGGISEAEAYIKNESQGFFDTLGPALTKTLADAAKKASGSIKTALQQAHGIAEQGMVPGTVSGAPHVVMDPDVLRRVGTPLTAAAKAQVELERAKSTAIKNSNALYAQQAAMEARGVTTTLSGLGSLKESVIQQERSLNAVQSVIASQEKMSIMMKAAEASHFRVLDIDKQRLRLEEQFIQIAAAEHKLGIATTGPSGGINPATGTTEAHEYAGLMAGGSQDERDKQYAASQNRLALLHAEAEDRAHTLKLAKEVEDVEKKDLALVKAKEEALIRQRAIMADIAALQRSKADPALKAAGIPESIIRGADARQLAGIENTQSRQLKNIAEQKALEKANGPSNAQAAVEEEAARRKAAAIHKIILEFQELRGVVISEAEAEKAYASGLAEKEKQQAIQRTIAYYKEEHGVFMSANAAERIATTSGLKNTQAVFMGVMESQRAHVNLLRQQAMQINQVAGQMRMLGTVAVGALLGAVASTKELVQNYRLLAEETGTNFQEAQKLIAAFNEYGISSQQGERSLKIFAKTLQDASEGAGKARDKFIKLNLSQQDIADAGPSMVDKLLAVADVVSKISDPVERLARMTDLFGKGAVQLVPLIMAGKEAIVAAMGTATTMTDKESASLIEMSVEIEKTKNSMMIMVAKGINAMAPALHEVLGQIEGVVKWLGSMDDSTKLLIGRFAIYGGALLLISSMTVPLITAMIQLTSLMVNLALGAGIAAGTIVTIATGIGALVVGIGLLVAAYIALHGAQSDEAKSAADRITQADEYLKRLKEIQETNDKLKNQADSKGKNAAAGTDGKPSPIVGADEQPTTAESAKPDHDDSLTVQEEIDRDRKTTDADNARREAQLQVEAPLKAALRDRQAFVVAAAANVTRVVKEIKQRKAREDALAYEAYQRDPWGDSNSFEYWRSMRYDNSPTVKAESDANNVRGIRELRDANAAKKATEAMQAQAQAALDAEHKKGMDKMSTSVQEGGEVATALKEFRMGAAGGTYRETDVQALKQKLLKIHGATDTTKYTEDQRNKMAVDADAEIMQSRKLMWAANDKAAKQAYDTNKNTLTAQLKDHQNYTVEAVEAYRKMQLEIIRNSGTDPATFKKKESALNDEVISARGRIIQDTFGNEQKIIRKNFQIQLAMGAVQGKAEFAQALNHEYAMIQMLQVSGTKRTEMKRSADLAYLKMYQQWSKGMLAGEMDSIRNQLQVLRDQIAQDKAQAIADIENAHGEKMGKFADMEKDTVDAVAHGTMSESAGERVLFELKQKRWAAETEFEKKTEAIRVDSDARQEALYSKSLATWRAQLAEKQQGLAGMPAASMDAASVQKRKRVNEEIDELKHEISGAETGLISSRSAGAKAQHDFKINSAVQAATHEREILEQRKRSMESFVDDMLRLEKIEKNNSDDVVDKAQIAAEEQIDAFHKTAKAALDKTDAIVDAAEREKAMQQASTQILRDEAAVRQNIIKTMRESFETEFDQIIDFLKDMGGLTADALKPMKEMLEQDLASNFATKMGTPEYMKELATYKKVVAEIDDINKKGTADTFGGSPGEKGKPGTPFMAAAESFMGGMGGGPEGPLRDLQPRIRGMLGGLQSHARELLGQFTGSNGLSLSTDHLRGSFKSLAEVVDRLTSKLRGNVAAVMDRGQMAAVPSAATYTAHSEQPVAGAPNRAVSASTPVSEDYATSQHAAAAAGFDWATDPHNPRRNKLEFDSHGGVMTPSSKPPTNTTSNTTIHATVNIGADTFTPTATTKQMVGSIIHEARGVSGLNTDTGHLNVITGPVH